MAGFQLMYPILSGRFNTTRMGYVAWEHSCEDHGWSPSDEIWALADTLMCNVASWSQPYNIFESTKFTYRFYRIREEYAKMARRTTQQKQAARAKWQGFIDYRLTEEQLMELDEWQPTPAEIWEHVDTLMSNNYRVTLSYRVDLKTATATIIDDETSRRSGGWALASSDQNCALALKAAVYKHFLVLQGSWEHLLDLPGGTGRRG